VDDLKRSEQAKLHVVLRAYDLGVAPMLRGGATLPQHRPFIVVAVPTDIWELADEIEAEPGEVLVRNGTPAGHAFVIRSGSAEAIGRVGRNLLGPGARFDADDADIVVTARSAMRLLVVDVPRATAMLGHPPTRQRHS